MIHPSRIMAIALAAIVSCACAAPTNNTNVNVNRNGNINANSAMAAADAGSLEAREPDNYSATMTISGQWSGGQRQGDIPTLQLDFARMGDDRRWSFNLPQPVGNVVYLERGDMKYLIIPSRNQYVELSPEDLGFDLGRLMTPAAVIERLKSRGKYETLGTETVNGRTATRYRFAGAADTRTQAGTVQADSFVYVDQQTGLPLRSDVNLTTDRGDTARIVTETRDIQLNPQPSLFEVPTNMKLVTAEELKQQVQGFIAAIRVFAEMIRQQQPGASPPPPPAPAANANR